MADLPKLFRERIIGQFGAEADAFLDAIERPAKVSVRLNRTKSSNSFDGMTPIPWNEEGRMLPERPVFTLDPLFHAGCYYPQESSSMFLQWVLNKTCAPTGNFRALDLCAAPGGKSLIISDFIGNRGVLVSNEVIRSRAHILKEVITKWGASNTVVTNAKAEEIGALSGWFDCIVVDAPCSGEGMFRKDPQARAEWNENSVDQCSMRQASILEDVLSALKESGILIYSTCTFAPQENELMLQSLVDSGDYESVRFDVPSDWPVDVVDDHGVFACRFLPHRVEGEGFFIGVLRKRASSAHHNTKGKRIFEPAVRKDREALVHFGIQSDEIVLGPDGEYYGSPLNCDALNVLATEAYVLMPGVHLGKLMRSELIPNHAIALAPSTFNPKETIELSLIDAQAYLRGDAIMINAADGWQVVSFQSQALGWVKVIGNRINNYYPKEWRVRMK
jgi:16S rRNA C967 or C1407 C5-methylase (RsmB/RsmF family)/NOL1/NOP2/fmu family ribosome biogenesis protein